MHTPTESDTVKNSPPSGRAEPSDAPAAGYGLRREVLSPMETLAQSVSTMAPTTTPAATIPLVCALAGNATWLAYVLATAAVLLVAWCIGRYARYSASPGSLYTYAAMTLPPWLAATVAWSLLLAYVATGSSVIGGFYHYANLLFRHGAGRAASAVVLATIVTGVSVWIAYRDVQISARLMLWVEASSVLVIVTLVGLLLVRHGMHWDWDQLRLRGSTGSGLRLGLVMALFSFCGFESATTLGSEARNPLRTIPRAVLLSAILGGAFFTVCAYAEVLGFHTVGQDLGTNPAPMHVLADLSGVPVFGLLIDVGALVSLFAGTLACITAAARVLLLMAHHGLAHPVAALDPRSQRNPQPRGHGHGPRRPASRGGARGARSQWIGCVRLARFAGHLRVHRGLRVGLCRSAALLTPARSLPTQRSDYPRTGLRCHAVGAGGQSLSCARRELRKVALHLPGVFGGGIVVVLAEWPQGAADERRRLRLSLRIGLRPAATRYRER